MQAEKIAYYAVVDYLALENDGEQRHEYDNGELVRHTRLRLPYTGVCMMAGSGVYTVAMKR